MGKKGFRHQYSWVIFSFGYQVGRVVCHGQCYPFIDGNLILEWTTKATIRLSRRSVGRLIDRPSFGGGGKRLYVL